MEIERKFLIQKMPEHPEQYKSHLIEQAYLNVRPVVRVRREDENYYMTYKGGGMMARKNTICRWMQIHMSIFFRKQMAILLPKGVI